MLDRNLFFKLPVQIIRPVTFTADRLRDEMGIANMNGISTRLYRTDQPIYQHVNGGDATFIVVDDMVDMHDRPADKTAVAWLTTGTIFYASHGTEDVASPAGESHIGLVKNQVID